MPANLTSRIIAAFGLTCVLSAANAQTVFNAGQATCQKAMTDIAAAGANSAQGSLYAPWGRAYIEGYSNGKQRVIQIPSYEALTTYLVSYCTNTGQGKPFDSRKKVVEATQCWIDKATGGSCTQGDSKP